MKTQLPSLIISLLAVLTVVQNMQVPQRPPQTPTVTQAKQRDEGFSSATIQIGDKIEDARRTFDKFQKFNTVGGFSFAKGPDDIENIFVRLDADHMNACLWYSKTTRQVTRMSIVCFPRRRSGKLYHTWIPVDQIALNSDGTHSIAFTKPLTIPQLDARDAEAAKHKRKSVLPPRPSGAFKTHERSDMPLPPARIPRPNSSSPAF